MATPTHWTYESFEENDDLKQGDIIKPTESLRSLLRDIHPHFLDPKYSAFLLITQSCDMVLRNSKVCSTRYLNIAVIRSLEDVLHDFLAHECKQIIDGVYQKESKDKAHQLMDRIFNQNEQSLGVFYLHPDEESGITFESIALLRVTVTLRVEHYEIVRNARQGRLKSQFRDKLGWLVGNLYSRVGTADWSEDSDRRKQVKSMIKQFLDDKDCPTCPIWVSQSDVDYATSNGINIAGCSKDELCSFLETNQPPSAKDEIVEQVCRIAQDICPSLDSATLTRLTNRLTNDPIFSKVVRRSLTEL